jgi:hypothetical protein
MFKKILVANRGDSTAGAAAEGGFAPAKPAAAKPHCTRSVRGDRAE